VLVLEEHRQLLVQELLLLLELPLQQVLELHRCC
jgi:hypothetical protein